MARYEFDDLKETSYANARLIIPHVLEKLGFTPKRLVDLGGGTGGWCKAFLEHGVEEVTCIDHPNTPKETLLISVSDFISCDVVQGFPVIHPCNMAISIEFAEHIPKEYSSLIVDFLVESSPLILFSAAIPNQGGVRHVNEQRHSYWKSLFSLREYECFDIIRQDILFNKDVSYYLRQNLFLYAKKGSSEYLKLKQYQNLMPDDFEIVSEYILNKDPSFKKMLFIMWKKIKKNLFHS